MKSLAKLWHEIWAEYHFQRIDGHSENFTSFSYEGECKTTSYHEAKMRYHEACYGALVDSEGPKQPVARFVYLWLAVLTIGISNVYFLDIAFDMLAGQRQALRYTNTNFYTLAENHNVHSEYITRQTEAINTNTKVLVDHQDEFFEVYQLFFKLAVMDAEQHNDNGEKIIELNRQMIMVFRDIIHDTENNNRRLEKIEALINIK